MQWQAHFSIGDPEIDRQHQNLFTMVEHLKRSLNTNAMYDNMGKALKFMVEYTNSHFEKEEAYMQAIAYTGLASHRELHRNLAREVQNILLKIKQDKHVFPTELINLTTEMLLDHTLVEDLKIRRHLQEATRAQEASRLEMFRQFRQTTAGALDQVTRLHQKETVTEAAYQDKKQALLKAFVRIEPPIPMEEITDRIALLESFGEKGLLDETETRHYKVALFANVDLEAELARRRRDKSKLTYLKSLLAKELITEETFQCHARRFTGADVDDAGPDEDVVRL